MAQATTTTQKNAVIIYDDQTFESLTQPYVVLVDGQPVFRANTYASCERHIAWKRYVLLA